MTIDHKIDLYQDPREPVLFKYYAGDVKNAVTKLLPV